MSRRTHRFVAFLVLLGTFFVQLSVAAFACPLVVPPGDAPPMPAMHEGCTGTQAAQAPAPAPASAALCELHCQSAASVPSTPVAPVALVSSAPLVIEVHDAATPSDGVRNVRVQGSQMATAPPVSILYCRLQV
jgi:hypothetical protein